MDPTTQEQKDRAFVGCYTDPEQAAAIKQLAARADRTVSSWLRTRLRRIIDEEASQRTPTPNLS